MKNNNSKKKIPQGNNVKDVIYKISIVLGEILLIFFILMLILNPSAVGRFFKSIITTWGGTTCTLNGEEYNIELDSNYHFECEKCSPEMKKDIKDNHIIYIDYDKNVDSVENYFESKGGKCN